MTTDPIKWGEISFRLGNAEKALNNMGLAESVPELRLAWESFLNEFGIAIGWLITTAKSGVLSKDWGLKLKDDSTDKDEGLVFLREARNHVQHGITPFAEFTEPFVDVGGMVAMGGNSSGHFSNNYIINNGRVTNTGTFSITAQNGRIGSIQGVPNARITEMPTSVKLLPVKNDQKRKIVPVPRSVGGQGIEFEEPTDLAAKALVFLKGQSETLRQMIGIVAQR